MRPIRRRYLDVVRPRGSVSPTTTSTLEPGVRTARGGCSARTPRRRVPCNNDLLAANFIDDGERIWIIDYEYAGQNEPSFELGNLASENGLDREPHGRAHLGLLGRGRRPQGRPCPGLGHARALRLDAVGGDPGRGLRDRLRLLVLGHGEVRRRARGCARRLARPPRRSAGRWPRDPDRRATSPTARGSSSSAAGSAARASPTTWPSVARQTCSSSSAPS